MHDIKLKILGIIANIMTQVAGVSQGEVTMHAHLVKDLDLDELTYIEFITAVEDVFAMHIDENKPGLGSIKDEDRKFITIGDLVNYIDLAVTKGEIELPDEKSVQKSLQAVQ